MSIVKSDLKLVLQCIHEHSLCITNEPHHEKTGFFANAKTKAQISFAVTAKLIGPFVFATRIVQLLLYVYPKFQDPCFFL